MEKHSAALIYICDPQPEALWQGCKNWILPILCMLWVLSVLYDQLGVYEMNPESSGLVGGTLVEDMDHTNWLQVI